MTEHRHDVEDDPTLAGLLSEVRGGVEARPIRRGNFYEAVLRAHRGDPETVPRTMVEEAAALASVVSLAGARGAAPAADPELEAFIEDVRANGEAAAAERRLAGIPALLTAKPARRWWRAIAGVSVAAAAALLVVLGADPGGSARFSPQVDGGMMARVLEGARGASVRARVMAAEPAAAVRTGPPAAATSADRDASDGSTGASIDPDPGTTFVSHETDQSRKEERRSTKPTRRPAPQLSEFDAAIDPLIALDEAAQLRWREGDRQGAEALFREIIRRDRSGRWTHLAYGDLFVLVRERGDQPGEEALWREYLERYPRGPHADDASAGLCRRAGAGATVCWLRYLEQRPTGVYRRQAERWLDGHAAEAP
ncbi:MAG: hypothetical protein IPK80_04680 [Nannocystis sp.]|nr:hypothetical protein [Nannocystis sp.]